MIIKTLFIFLVLYCSTTQGIARDDYPEYKYQKHLHGWTKLHDKPATWKTASENCQKEGAILVSTSSKKLYDTLKVIIKDSKKSINTLYIGAKTVYSGDTNCKVYINQNSTTGSVDCNQEHPYVCFALAPPVDCDVHELGQDREGYPGYNRCSKIKGWLKLHVEPANFERAQQRCQKENATLIYPWDEEFKKAAFKLIQSNNTDDDSFFLVYSGGQVTYPYGGFLENDGNLKYYKEMRKRCIIFKPDVSLHRTSCQQEFAFICYAPFAKYHCGDKNHELVGRDYELDPRTGHCYKIDISGKTWNKSRESCQKEGGDLAVINSPEEAKFLAMQYARHKSLVGVDCDESEVFVGFQESEIGIWKTIEDETLEEAGYAGWGDGKPANKQSGGPDYVKGVRQTCGTMDNKGRLSDCWCDVPHAHICEKMATVISEPLAAPDAEEDLSSENK